MVRKQYILKLFCDKSSFFFSHFWFTNIVLIQSTVSSSHWSCTCSFAYKTTVINIKIKCVLYFKLSRSYYWWNFKKIVSSWGYFKCLLRSRVFIKFGIGHIFDFNANCTLQKVLISILVYNDHFSGVKFVKFRSRRK